MLNIMLTRKLVPHFVPSYGLITTSQKVYKDCSKIFPTRLALCSMLSETNYAQNYAEIIGLGIACIKTGENKGKYFISEL